MSTPPFRSAREAVVLFDRMVTTARAALASVSDADLMVKWTLKNAGATIFALPRIVVIRTWVVNHCIHHRGQLSVYLRLRDVLIPSIYGPSADEQP